MKFQGMVGIMGNGGKTRLTWFVNMDFGGLVPSSFTQAFLLGTLSFPISVVQETKNYLLEEDADNSHGGKGANSATTTLSASELVELELPDLKAKLAEMKAEMERKNEEWRRKDEEHQKELATNYEELRRKDDELENKGKQIIELRKRLPRVVDQD